MIFLGYKSKAHIYLYTLVFNSFYISLFLHFHLNNQFDEVIFKEDNINSIFPSSVSSVNKFQKVLSEFNWDAYISSVLNITQNNLQEIEKHLETLIEILTEFVIIEPPVSINNSCSPPVLKSHKEIVCPYSRQFGVGNAFSGEKLALNSSRKIGILIQFGFEVDLLEIYLHEVYDVVDKFFILESTKSHFRANKKSLIWHRVKNEKRFRKFSDKIVHFIMDDADSAYASIVNQKISKFDDESNKKWAMEAIQERVRWKKFLQWNNIFQYFGPDDFLGFGDVDEIPSRSMLNLLKYCVTKKPIIDFGIWFPFGNIKYAFQTDFPIVGHKYTYGDPTFWTLSSAVNYSRSEAGNFPNRNRGLSDSFILGGIHMTHYGYLPYQLIRRISCTECKPYPPSLAHDLKNDLKNGDIRKLELGLSAVPQEYKKRIVELESIKNEMKHIAILPWFYDCNRDRYPVWEGKHDTRLDL